MVRRLLVLSALCGCTQNFDTFNPTDDASVVDVATDGPGGPETGVDSGSDVTLDVSSKDAAPDVTPADAPSDAPVPCTETGAIQYGGHCYFLVSGAEDFNTAKANCQQAANAHLVTITSAGEQAAVIALGNGSERWIGLYRNGGPAKDQTYAWITGENRNGYNAWSPGEPNGTGQCGTLLGTGLWNDENCSMSLASICERE
jgi:hypothetical protein